MTTIITRVTTQPDATPPLGAPLSSAQIDQNFINLNVNKLEITAPVSTNTGSTVVKRDSTGSFSAQDINANSIGLGTSASGTTGELFAAGQIISFYSDERLKENIEPITNALDKVASLRGVTYTANDLAESLGFINKDRQVGVFAQDVEKVQPEAVKPAPFDLVKSEDGTEISKSGENYKTVQYEKLVPLLVEAIKELNNQIKELKGIK